MSKPIRINLGLQGGGAHGAYSWGVLDRFLAEDGLEIAAISGTSAGALNGAAVKSGLLKGGPEAARENLDWLWRQVGMVEHAAMPGWMQAWMPEPERVSKALENAVPYVWAESASRMMSPYNWGPFYDNPLTRIVKRFDYDKVCASEGPRLFVAATCVRDGKIRVFTGHQITTDAILASACLPTLFQAVEVTDPETGIRESFWDGGYTGNPPLFPLFEKDLPDDIIVVNINPLNREKLPVTAPEIQNRINEISFNSSLLRELRAIDFVQRLIEGGSIPEGAMKKPLVHMIADDELMNALSIATKLVPVPSVIAQLKAAGQRAASEFLSQHKDDLGRRQTTDLRTMFS